MSGKEIIESFIEGLVGEKGVYDEITRVEGGGVRDKFLQGCSNDFRGDRISRLFPGKKQEDSATKILFIFGRNKFELIKAALETKAKNAALTEEEANYALKIVRDAFEFDEGLLPLFDDTIALINGEVVLKKDMPELTGEEFSGMKDRDVVEASWVYEGHNLDGSPDDKSSDMRLVKWNGKVYIFCKKQDDEYECKEVKNVGEVAAAVQAIGPDKQGQKYLNTQNRIKIGKLVKIGETRKGVVSHSSLNDKQLKDLLVKLESGDAMKSSDKSLLLMISEVFVADNGMSGLFQRPLNLEETKDFLRFLTQGIAQVKDPTFAARIILGNQEKLNEIKTAFVGTNKSFASEFFQSSQYAEYTKDNFITSGPGKAFSSEVKSTILTGNKSCLYNSGAHYFGLVFGPKAAGKRKIYIQDSTETVTTEITGNYETAIRQFYAGEYEIVKTVRKKDTTPMFDSRDGGSGIQNQCRYSAIIFSERVLAEVKAGQSPKGFSIKYGQTDFENKFVEWFDKSKLGQEISSPKKSPTPKVEKSKSEVLRFIAERHAKFDFAAQDRFNSAFKLRENLAKGETVESYVKKRLEESGPEKIREFLAEPVVDNLQFGNDRSFHGAYHSIITAAYTGMFADFYSKHFAGKFGIPATGLTEEKRDLAMILTSAHDISRINRYVAHDEHNNAFYLALILKDRFGLPQDSAIEFASHIARKDERPNPNKTIFSRLTQCADCAAIVRTTGSERFNEEFLDAKNDLKELGGSAAAAAAADLKSILDFTKALENKMKIDYGDDWKSAYYDKKLASFDEAINHIKETTKDTPDVGKGLFLGYLESFRSKRTPALNQDSANVAKLIKVKPIDFPQQNAAEEFNKLDEANQREISERTRVTVTQEEIDHAKRFIALVAITGGETGRESDKKEISQKEVYEQQGILPTNCLEGLKITPLSQELIESVAAKITPENIRAFYKRLIEKRPKAFYGANDGGFRGRGDLPHKFKGDDLNLPEYVGYSEIEFGAMLQVFGATQFINDGGRGNLGKIWKEGGATGAHEKSGYISAIAGMRLEADNAMERLHVIGGERDKAITEYKSSKARGSKKGEFARMKGVNDTFVEGHKLIWDQFYQKNSPAKDGVGFNEKIAEQRLYISYKKFLAESIANAEQDGKKAHIRITGCGDGVWAGDQEAKVKSAIGKAVRRAFNDLGEEQKSQISAIEFCQHGDGEDYHRAFKGGDKAEALNGVKIVKSGAKFSEKLEESEKKSDGKDTVLCVNFAWDGGSYVGNEYWNEAFAASGDPAAACCSSIAISMNPEINPQFLDKLFVVSKKGAVIEFGKSKSEFVSLNYESGTKAQIGSGEYPYRDFIATKEEVLKKVPVAITGSVDDGMFWKITGGGMNGQLASSLPRADLLKANAKLAKAAGIFKGDKKEATGAITQVNLELKGNPQVQTILYSASPDLSSLDAGQARKAMIDFGAKFRNQLSEQKIPELCLPLFSGGIYRGETHTQEQVAEWLMEGWFAAETENPAMKSVKVYLGHQCLEDAVKKMHKTTTSLASSAQAKAETKSGKEKSKTGSEKKNGQLTRGEILDELYSDHLPQVFDIKLTAPKKTSTDSAKESIVKILSWNVLGQCRKESQSKDKTKTFYANNPWNHLEITPEFEARRVRQNEAIAVQVKKDKIDIICLQEYIVKDEAPSKALCDELKAELGGEWDYKFSKSKEKKLNVTFYNGANLKVVGEVQLGLNTNDAGQGSFNCATELKFNHEVTKQEFIVSNVHSAAYGKKAKVEEYLSKKRDLPFFAVGDFNEDAKSFTGTHKPVAPNGATNFDAPLVNGIYDRRDDAEMVVQDKCYDMAFVTLPEGFKVEATCHERVFNEKLQSISNNSKKVTFSGTTIPAKDPAKASKKTDEQYQLDLLDDNYFDKLTSPLRPEEIKNGYLDLSADREDGVNYKEIEELNPLPVEDAIEAPLWLKRSQPNAFLNDEFIGEDVQAYYKYLFTTKYPQANGFADYGAVGIVQGANDLLAERMAETIRNEKWGFYSYSTGGHWVLVVLSPDKKVTYLDSVGEGEIAMNQGIQVDINRAFALAEQGNQFGETKAYGLGTQMGVQCGLHSVLAAEEILRELVKSSKDGAKPTFSMKDVIKKCTTSSDQLHKKPTIKEILTARWNASSEQFKTQRENAYDKVIARKENLIRDELMTLKEGHAEKVNINRMLLYSHGDFSASEVAERLSINLSDEGTRAAEEIKELKNAREADSIKYQMNAFREGREDPEPEEESFLNQTVSAYYKTVRELTRESTLTKEGLLSLGEGVKELFELYRQSNFGDDQTAFLEAIAEEKTMAEVFEELRKKKEKESADLGNLETLKTNLAEARELVAKVTRPDIAGMSKEDIVTETMRHYKSYLDAGVVEKVALVSNKIFDCEEYSAHEIYPQIMKKLFSQELSPASELTPTQFLAKSIASITSPGNREKSIRVFDASSEDQISNEIAGQILEALKNPNCRVTNSEFGNNKIDPEILGQINDQLKINKSQNAFQDAVYDVFKHKGKSSANAQERARLRDQLADAVCPPGVLRDLESGRVQLDTTEFLNYFLDAALPSEKRIKVTSSLNKKDPANQAETQLNLPFVDGGKVSDMIKKFEAEEEVAGAGIRVLKPEVTKENEELVFTLKRFETYHDGSRLKSRKIDRSAELDEVQLGVEGSSEKQRYRPTSFIVHSGGINGGHYVAYVQEEDKEWYCYNDSNKTKIEKEALEAAKKQAYVVKYSLIDADGKCKLPKSQGDNGTANGGNRCWANAAFAFALSMVSLHDDDRERGVAMLTPQELYEDSCRTSGAAGDADQLVGTVLELDGNEEGSLKDVIEALQEIDALGNEKKAALNQKLEEIGAVSTSRLLENAVEKYLFSLIEDQVEDGKIEAILGLQGFLSYERNKIDALKIFNAIEGDKGAFISDPVGFCSEVIDSGGKGESGEGDRLKLEARRYVTTADLCYNAISEDDIDKLKELLPNAIKLNEDFLTNALCHAVEEGHAKIAQLLIDKYRANPDKKSSIYKKTANELDKDEILKEKLGLKGGRGGSGSGSDSDSEDDEKSLGGSEGGSSEEIEIEGMKVGKDKTITLDLKDGGTGEDSSIVITKGENQFLKVKFDDSSGKPLVKIKNEDFRSELMKYYLSGPGKNEDARAKYEAPEEEMKGVGNEALEVLNIYRAVPSTSIALKSVSKVIVGDLIKGR